ncbi:hypothetical protein GGI00_000869, partial [Coemansia sp. RSA 2681]
MIHANDQYSYALGAQAAATPQSMAIDSAGSPIAYGQGAAATAYHNPSIVASGAPMSADPHSLLVGGHGQQSHSALSDLAGSSPLTPMPPMPQSAMMFTNMSAFNDAAAAAAAMAVAQGQRPPGSMMQAPDIPLQQQFLPQPQHPHQQQQQQYHQEQLSSPEGMALAA